VVCSEKVVENGSTEAQVDFMGKYTTPVGLSVSVDTTPFVLSEFSSVIWQDMFIKDT